MKLVVKVSPEEVEPMTRRLMAEVYAKRDRVIDPAYFITCLKEDFTTAMQHAFDAGREFERTQTKTL